MGTVPLDPASARSFLANRLATLLLMAAIFAAAVALSGPLLVDVLGWQSAAARLSGTDTLLHGPLAVVMLAGWLYLRRATPTLAQLGVVDAAATVGTGSALAAMMYFSDATFQPESGHVLAITHLLVARAALVPSTAPRTLGLGALATAPLVLVTFEAHARAAAPAPDLDPLLSMAVATFWCALAVAASWVVSRVVYGLHERVREAMQLGQYVVDYKLGEGGMGVVFKAHHAMLRRPTALKVLHPEKAGAENMARFEKEVQVTATLTHPNVIAVYDYGKTAEGALYYAMEYVEGLSLQALVDAHGPQPAGRVVHLLRQVCGALYEAHCAGLVHRDVKPANILVSLRGQLADFVKVVDFGLVKQLGSSSSADRPAGTPLYMAPEAAVSPQDVGAAADLYAVGAVGYFLLTGTPVFQGRSAKELSLQHLRAVPEAPAQRLGKPVAADLEAVLLRCLEKDPALRPADARELAELLAACADATTWQEPEARRWWDEAQRRALSPPSPPPLPLPALPPAEGAATKDHGQVSRAIARASQVVAFALAFLASAGCATSGAPARPAAAGAAHPALRPRPAACFCAQPGESMDARALSERLLPSVVDIATVESAEASFFEDPFGFLLDADGAPQRVWRHGQATGFVIESPGLVVTAAHAVVDASIIRARTASGDEVRARIVGIDPLLDVALLQLDAGVVLPAATLGNSADVAVGEPLLAIGNPFGLGHTVTGGVVSAKGRVIGLGPYDDLIQTDAAINPGHSGGPLFDRSGRVVAVAAAIERDGVGTSFAVPIDAVKAVLAELRSTGRVRRAVLGVAVQQVTPALAATLGLDRPRGALVVDVVPDGAAALAGLQPADVVLDIEGQALLSSEDLPRLVARQQPAAVVTVGILRGKATRRIRVKLDETPEPPRPESLAPRAAASPVALALGVELSRGPDGSVAVVAVVDADKVGELDPGDVLLALDGKPIHDVVDVSARLKRAPHGARLLFRVRRDGVVRFVTTSVVR